MRVVTNGEPQKRGEIGSALAQFVAAARNVLSGAAVGTVTREIGTSATARLVKNNGQERLIVNLAPGTSDVAPQPRAPDVPQVRNPPDYCVVDFVIPDNPGQRANFLALGLDPDQYLETPFAGEKEFDFFDAAGLGTYSETTGRDNPLMRYSRHDLDVAYVEIENRVASLLLDLRQLGPQQIVELEVWGVARPRLTAYLPLDSRVGVGFQNFATGEFFWSDGSGTPNDGSFLDPRGNPSVRFLGNPAGVAQRFSNVMLAGIITEFLRPDLWTETVFDPAYLDPTSFTLTPVPAYLQRRLDPSTGAELAFRVMVITCNFRSDDVTDDLKKTAWGFTVAERVRNGPPDDVPVKRQVDVVTGFYWARPLAAYTSDGDGAGIWAVEDGEIPERTKIGESEIWNVEQPGSVEFTPDSGPMTLLGTVRVDRDAQVVSFEPGS